MKLKARITFMIGLLVAMLFTVKMAINPSFTKIPGIAIGIFLLIFGWKIGWTTYKRFTILLGHFAITGGCLATAYAIYNIPFLDKPPLLAEVLDFPLFWGLLSIFGGVCMISHGNCNCTIAAHNKVNK